MIDDVGSLTAELVEAKALLRTDPDSAAARAAVKDASRRLADARRAEREARGDFEQGSTVDAIARPSTIEATGTANQ